MKEIILTQGKISLVDDGDYEWLNDRKWCAHRNKNQPVLTFYARTATMGITAMMHRVILGLNHGDKRQCDHVDGNGLNNQRSNLRICTIRENQHNRRSGGGTSRYKGVTLCGRSGKWIARIRGVAGKNMHLGTFDCESDAARCYDLAALKYFGKFARFNFSETERVTK